MEKTMEADHPESVEVDSSTLTTSGDDLGLDDFVLPEFLVLQLENDDETSESGLSASTTTADVQNGEGNLKSGEVVAAPTLYGESCTEPGCSSLSRDAQYGNPKSADELAAEFSDLPASTGANADDGHRLGIEWKVIIVPEDFKVGDGLSKRDVEKDGKSLKTRRATFPVVDRDFSASLVPVETENGGKRWIFSGVLNGWPGVRCLELIKVEWAGLQWTTKWTASKEGAAGVTPPVMLNVPSKKQGSWFGDRKSSHIRATVRGPPWSAQGWSRESPGFVFWYEAQRKDSQGSAAPRVIYGTKMVEALEQDRLPPMKPSKSPNAVQVHMISHRYALGKKRASLRDNLTYHSVVFLEWDHGQYGTVVETAYLNGMGGYHGKSNWYADSDAEISGLYRALRPEMIAPWKVDCSEIRCYDVPYSTVQDFVRLYITPYEGSSGRFLDPRVNFSHPVRLSFCSKEHIARYLVNYIRRDRSYSEMRRNCQTFAADLCGFLAGKKDVQPFHPVNQIKYRNQTHTFLYESTMYRQPRRSSSLMLSTGEAAVTNPVPESDYFNAWQ